MNALIDGSDFLDPTTNTAVFSYARPIFGRRSRWSAAAGRNWQQSPSEVDA